MQYQSPINNQVGSGGLELCPWIIYRAPTQHNEVSESKEKDDGVVTRIHGARKRTATSLEKSIIDRDSHFPFNFVLTDELRDSNINIQVNHAKTSNTRNHPKTATFNRLTVYNLHNSHIAYNILLLNHSGLAVEYPTSAQARIRPPYRIVSNNKLKSQIPFN